jgi:peptide/nickel transport system ATP-binding protein
MLITHDMGVIAETTDRVAVLYAGRGSPRSGRRAMCSAHPSSSLYRRDLMASTPSTTGIDANALSQIPGAMPNLRAIPKGCAFNPRCDKGHFGVCLKDIPVLEQVDGSEVACWLYDPAYKSYKKETSGASE